MCPAAAQNKDFKKLKASSSEGSPSKTYPKSLLLSEMLRLVKCQTSETTIVSMFKFDMDTMSWSKGPERLELLINKEVLCQGGFRKAYKVTSQSNDYHHKTWVIKRSLEQTVQAFSYWVRTLNSMPRKSCKRTSLNKLYRTVATEDSKRRCSRSIWNHT